MLVCRDRQDIDGSDERDKASSFGCELDAFEEEVWESHFGFVMWYVLWKMVNLFADGWKSLLSEERGLEDEESWMVSEYLRQGRPLCYQSSW